MIAPDQLTNLRASAFIQQKLYGSRRQPAPPRSLVAQPGSFKSVITWNDPQDSRGIVGYVVYLDKETSPFARVGLVSPRVEVPLTSGAARQVMITSINQLGVESQRAYVTATSATDTYNGGSAGSSPSAPPSWPNEPTGGGTYSGAHGKVAF